jgi:hypothetical protein
MAREKRNAIAFNYIGSKSKKDHYPIAYTENEK